ncbi:MAG: SDR family oxidoreductase [Bacteroidales bacterium]|nr:SDR family oxidoreductase [Bacteroidales bacterium]MDT8431397.1 SDR family oxidoreductase [Bacteroidales bacterium]
MKILLTGLTGYIGKRLLPVLLEHGHEVISLVRDKTRVQENLLSLDHHRVIEGDLLDPESLKNIPVDIDITYYLVHSMSALLKGFQDLEERSATNFVERINRTNARQIIYLSGISNSERLSSHLASRKSVEEILKRSAAAVTILRAGIIVGSGSASFEIIRDLVEKLPVMVTPKWLNTRCQPIAIRNVIGYLEGVIGLEKAYDQTFDIGGKEVLTYKDMLLQFAEVRKLRRWIYTLPVMTPRLSSYWLYFITSTSYNLAVNLVNSMKIEVVTSENRIRDIVDLELIDYRNSIRLAFERMEQNLVLSSWKDAMVSGNRKIDVSAFIEVPVYGCFKDVRKVPIEGDPRQVLENIWSIGGERGWYYADTLWRFRGFLDKLTGGVGLRRGRTNLSVIHPGDALDFWRVIIANKKESWLLLFAEMKVPGEAWLEFRIRYEPEPVLVQTATFRPKGLWGRIYWHMMSPAHFFIFRKMAVNIATYTGK